MSIALFIPDETRLMDKLGGMNRLKKETEAERRYE
jgi:hypothetical protein